MNEIMYKLISHVENAGHIFHKNGTQKENKARTK